MKSLLLKLSSLRLTVWLLTFSMALIFFGTLAQVETGIWKTQKDYFESLFVVWSYPATWAGYDNLYWLRIPMLGGYSIGALLLLNLSSAFLVRFKARVSKIGIYAIHIGLITMLVSEILTDFLSVESNMLIEEGSSANYSTKYRSNELVLIDRSASDFDTVHSVPASLLQSGQSIQIPDTPLSIRVVSYYPAANYFNASQGMENLATQGAGLRMGMVAQPTDYDYSDKGINTAAAYIEVISPEGSMGTWLTSLGLDDRYPPQIIKYAEQEWELSLRPTRIYHPFSIELIDFKFDRYPGTQIPFNYSSEVIVRPTDHSSDTKALVYMNHPLRYAGLTFYQSSFTPDELGTVFQVVRNPGWTMPYISVTLMGFGMLFQFLFHFSKFLKQRSH